MIRDFELSTNAIAGGSARTGNLVARAPKRTEKWFHRPNQEQLNRELDLRLEEQLRERARIARELHDTLFQGFLGASMQLHAAVEQMPADSPSKPPLNRALCLMQRVIDEGRDVLQGLRSSRLASMSLEEALSCVRDEFTPSGGARFRIFVKGQPKALKPVVREQIYLIGREALVNALRHSKATSIEAEVEYLPRRLRVVVRDNGCGIDPQLVRPNRQAPWGLIGMRERAGSISAKLRIWSRPGTGTEVEVSIPSHVVADACA
jgi:signal transduction histidine kinase